MIQLFCDGSWRDVACVRFYGKEREGWRAKTYTGYDIPWAVNHFGARDAHALSCQFEVSLDALEPNQWPAFLIDLLPQGFGREELLHRIRLSPTAAEEADWRLLLAGAGNPIGNLRVKEAAKWLKDNDGISRGFTDGEVAQCGEDFAEYLASDGLFVAGSSGVQDECLKVLLTRADDGLLYLDHTLADERAREHFIVKFGHGTNVELATMLRHEAPYMALAERLGLRVHAPLVMKERALFVRRFDRQVGAHGITRFAQESIATLTGIPGFGAVPSHDQVCRELIACCTNPQLEVLEYIKRDVANIALGNTDNHARNTALQRDFSEGVRLTPLYDFMPTYLHPDGIARRIRWEDNDEGAPDWGKVLDRVCELALEFAPAGGRSRSSKPEPALQREGLVQGLRAMATPLREIAEGAPGVDQAVSDYLRLGILQQADRLEKLT